MCGRARRSGGTGAWCVRGLVFSLSTLKKFEKREMASLWARDLGRPGLATAGEGKARESLVLWNGGVYQVQGEERERGLQGQKKLSVMKRFFQKMHCEQTLGRLRP